MREKSQKFHCRTVRNNKRREAEEFQKCVQNVGEVCQECVFPSSLPLSLSFCLSQWIDTIIYRSIKPNQQFIHLSAPRLCLCASFCGNLLWLPFVVCGPSCLCVCIGKPLKVRDTHTSFGITNMHLICSHQKPFPSITHTPRGTRRKSEHV